MTKRQLALKLAVEYHSRRVTGNVDEHTRAVVLHTAGVFLHWLRWGTNKEKEGKS